MEFAGKRRILALATALAAAGLIAAVMWWSPWNSGPRNGSASAQASGIVVEVRNGTSRAGLARQVARLLRERGVDVVSVGTSPARPDSTTVLVRRGNLAAGHEVARLLGGARVRPAPDSLLRVDLTVLLGADYRLPRGRLAL